MKHRHVCRYYPSKKHRNTSPDDVVALLRQAGASQEEAADAMEFASIVRDAKVALSVDDVHLVACSRRLRRKGVSPSEFDGSIWAKIQRETGNSDDETWASIESLILNGFIEILPNDRLRVCSPDEVMQKQMKFAADTGAPQRSR
jgi:hypothetical protein